MEVLEFDTAQSHSQAQEVSITFYLLWFEFSRDCQTLDLSAENILGTIWIALFTATRYNSLL